VPYPTDHPALYHFLPKRLAEFASENPILGYQQFMNQTAIPHVTLFAFLEAFGEVGVGLGLTLGVLTSFSALVGLLMSINFFLAMQWMGFCSRDSSRAGGMSACFPGWPGRSELGPRCLDLEREQSLAAAPCCKLWAGADASTVGSAVAPISALGLESQACFRHQGPTSLCCLLHPATTVRRSAMSARQSVMGC